ncbi:MAG: nitrile hydratase subunit beta [Candidatus Acidiferrales bacterium]
MHDMGGMHGMGPIQHETNEPVFHERWEARAYGLSLAMGCFGKWTLDALRHQIEQIPPADYLSMSYYEKWIAALVELMVKTNLVTRAESETGKAAPGSPKMIPALTPDGVSPMVRNGAPANRDTPATPRFQRGQRVRARNLNPAGHTRLPRYARGKSGAIERDYGVFVFPDTNAHERGENPQHVYSVRFAARELWGEQVPAKDSVYVDMWESYLEPA